MAINTNFRVKNGLYVGSSVDALRGDLSASNIYGKLFALSGTGVNGSGSDTALSGQETLNYEAVSGVNVSVSNSNIRFGLNVNTDNFIFDGGVLKLSPTGTYDFGTVNVGGGFNDTGVTISSTGNISADGDLYISGNTTLNGTLDAVSTATFSGGLSASTLSGNGNNLTSNFTLSAGGDVDGVSTNITALNGTYTLDLELTNVFTNNPGSFGSTTAIPIITVDADGRLTAASTAAISDTLNIAADGTSGDVSLLTETLSVKGTTNEIETAASNNVITIGLPDNVTVTGDLTVGGNDIKDSSGSAALTFDGSQNTTAKGDLTVVGDFTVSGDTTTQNVSTVLVEDPVIKLANGNTADSLDIGFYGEYVGVGTSKYAGLIRDITFAGGNKPFVFFDGTETDILSANASGSGKPGLSNFADVYMGRIGINTTDYNASNRLTVSGAISGDSTLTIDGIASFKGNVTLGDASGDTLTINAETINPVNIAAGTDNTVVVYNGSSLVTDEIDSRVWGSTLIDTSYFTSNVTGTTNHIAFFTGTNTVSSESSGELYWDSTNNRLGINTATPNEALTVTGNISASGIVYADAFNSLAAGSTIDFNDDIALAGNLSFSPSSDILIPDHSGAALEIKEGGNLYQRFVTTNGSEGVEISKQLTITMVSGTTNSVLIQDSGVVKKRDINSRVWGSSLVDGSGTDNRLTKWTETGDTVGDSRVSDDDTDIVIGVGAANPVTFSGSSTSTSVTYNDTTGYHSISAALPATCSNLPVFTKSATGFRSSKVIVQSVLGSTQYEIAELLLIHNGTNVYITEYGNISTGSGICTTYSADINAGSVRILASNAHASVDSVITTSVQQFLI